MRSFWELVQEKVFKWQKDVEVPRLEETYTAAFGLAGFGALILIIIPDQMRFEAPIKVGIFLLVALGHLVLSIRSRALPAAAVISAAYAGMVLMSIAAANFNQGRSIIEFVLIAFFVGFFAFLFNSIGVIATGFLRLKQRERELKNRSRQERIGRVLEIREFLSKNPCTDRYIIRSTIWDRIREKLYLWAGGSGFAISTVIILAVMIGDPSGEIMGGGQQQMQGVPPGWVVFIILFSLLQYVVPAILGYIARSLKAMTLSVLLFAVIGTVPVALIPSPMQIHFWQVDKLLLNLSGNLVLLIIGAFGYGAYRVNESLRLDEMRRNRDPETLAAELETLETELATQSDQRTVLVVDVVGSTRMKAAADPLVAEWCFREYQTLVQRIADEHNGEVISTAGDGVIMSFAEPHQAVESAKEILRGLRQFNSESNRLETPFRVRQGLHAGAVQGNLMEVQFTALIDVAAHVEARVLPGEIGVTARLAQKLTGVDLTPTELTVEGHEILLVGTKKAAPVRTEATPQPAVLLE